MKVMKASASATREGREQMGPRPDRSRSEAAAAGAGLIGAAGALDLIEEFGVAIAKEQTVPARGIQVEIVQVRAAFGFSLEQYLYFGGYPGAAPLVDDPRRWRRYW